MTLAPHPPHSHLHVLDFLGTGSHEGEDGLPLKLGDVHGVRDGIPVHVTQHVLELGGVVGLELGEDERAFGGEGALRSG